MKKVLDFLKNVERFRNFPQSVSSLSGKKKYTWYAFYILLPLLSTIALGLCSLLLAYGNLYSSEVFFNYFSNAYIVFLNLFPPVAIFVVFYAITGIMWVSYLADSIIVIGFSLANYFMLMFRNDPLMMSDVLYVREAMEISKEGYNYRLTLPIVTAIIVCVLFTALLFVFRCRCPKALFRISSAALTLVCSLLLTGVYFDEKVYDVKTDVIDENVMNRWSPTNQYLSKGFVYPFIHSAVESMGLAPDGYDAKRAEMTLSGYKDSDIPSDKKVNVVGIMLEAFCDLETLGIDGIDEDAYSYYRKLKNENLSGKLVTNIFAAGTIDSERGFLTGFTGLEHCRRNINSYVRYFSSQGYNTWGSHPSEDWFYNRKNVNRYIGFDSFLFKENHYEEKYGEYMRNDNVVFDDIYEQYVEITKNGSEPSFGFHVTYQGHGPYDASCRGWGTGAEPLYENPSISEESGNIINNYLGSLRSTGEHLYAFVNKMKERPEPVVLVIFGDHKPWLGDNNSVYEELGISFDLSTKEGFENYYSTEYIVIANDEAKRILDNDFKGQGPDTSPCFLMNVLFDELGFEGSGFMKYTNKVREHISVINEEGIMDTSGNFYTLDFMPESLEKVYDEYINTAYYFETNFKG